MAFCPSCGKPVNAGTPFCPSCGAGLTQHAAGGGSQGHAAAPVPAAPQPHDPLTATQAPPVVRPTGVTIIGGVMIVGGVIAAFVGLGVLFFLFVTGAMSADLTSSGHPILGTFVGIFAVLALVAFIFAALIGVLGIVTGVGMLHGRSWARAVAIGIMILNVVSGLGQLGFGFSVQGELASAGLNGLVGILVSGLVIWYLFRPEVTAWFERARS